MDSGNFWYFENTTNDEFDNVYDMMISSHDFTPGPMILESLGADIDCSHSVAMLLEEGDVAEDDIVLSPTSNPKECSFVFAAYGGEEQWEPPVTEDFTLVLRLQELFSPVEDTTELVLKRVPITDQIVYEMIGGVEITPPAEPEVDPDVEYSLQAQFTLGKVSNQRTCCQHPDPVLVDALDSDGGVICTGMAANIISGFVGPLEELYEFTIPAPFEDCSYNSMVMEDFTTYYYNFSLSSNELDPSLECGLASNNNTFMDPTDFESSVPIEAFPDGNLTVNASNFRLSTVKITCAEGPTPPTESYLTVELYAYIHHFYDFEDNDVTVEVSSFRNLGNEQISHGTPGPMHRGDPVPAGPELGGEGFVTQVTWLITSDEPFNIQYIGGTSTCTLELEDDIYYMGVVRSTHDNPEDDIPGDVGDTGHVDFDHTTQFTDTCPAKCSGNSESTGGEVAVVVISVGAIVALAAGLGLRRGVTSVKKQQRAERESIEIRQSGTEVGGTKANDIDELVRKAFLGSKVPGVGTPHPNLSNSKSKKPKSKKPKPKNKGV
ncbi:MAG: hypothetical protein ACTSUE_06080 [Promethearchaeota archaeon]